MKGTHQCDFLIFLGNHVPNNSRAFHHAMWSKGAQTHVSAFCFARHAGIVHGAMSFVSVPQSATGKKLKRVAQKGATPNDWGC